jgi:hypothetical protein
MAWQVLTSMQVPSSGTIDGDQFALVMSVFDSKNYYDQIGFASDYGCPSGCGDPSNTWSIAWEQGTWGTYGSTTGCGWGGLHSRDAYDAPGLSPGSWYTFALLLASNGSISFRVFTGQNSTATLLWQQWESDGANDFLIQNLDQYCNGNSQAGYGGASMTQYEEVEYINGNVYSQPVPRWDFTFNDTYIDSGGSRYGIPDSNDFAFSTGNGPTMPHGYFVDLTGGPTEVRIANEAFLIDWSTNSISLSPGGCATVYGNLVAVGDKPTTDYLVANSYSSSIFTGYGGLQSNGGSISGSVPSSGNSYSICAPVGTAAGQYYGGVTFEVYIGTSTEVSTWIFYVQVS